MVDEKLERILRQSGGIITTQDVQKENVSRTAFLEFVNKNGLTRIAHGIYSSDEAWPDIFRQLQLQYPSIVFSHESALYLHGMAEREPEPVAVTVKTNYHSSSMKKHNMKIYYVGAAMLELGLVEKPSPTGYLVRCYNLERTICDIIRSRNTVDYQELTGAVKAYVRRRDKNIPLLMRYGEQFRITSRLKTYLEVLL